MSRLVSGAADRDVAQAALYLTVVATANPVRRSPIHASDSSSLSTSTQLRLVRDGHSQRRSVYLAHDDDDDDDENDEDKNDDVATVAEFVFASTLRRANHRLKQRPHGED
ncbi:unnamed protein product [Lampetra planeri]